MELERFITTNSNFTITIKQSMCDKYNVHLQNNRSKILRVVYNIYNIYHKYIIIFNIKRLSYDENKNKCNTLIIVKENRKWEGTEQKWIIIQITRTLHFKVTENCLNCNNDHTSEVNNSTSKIEINKNWTLTSNFCFKMKHKILHNT